MRLILLYCYVSVHQLSIARCHDIGVNVKTTLGRDNLKKLQQYIPYIFRQDSKITDRNITMRQFALDDPVSNDVSAHKAKKNVQLLDQFKPNLNALKFKSLAEDTVFTFDVKERILSEGDLMLNNLGYKIINDISLTLDNITNRILENATNSYINELRAYSKFIIVQQLKYKIERDFYILDFVETSNKIFSVKSNTMLSNLTAQMNGTILNTDLKTLREETEIAILEQKIRTLQYVCQKLFICRYFPAYSDYIAKVISTILNLPDKKIQMILKLFKEIAGEKAPFFKTIMSKDIATRISLRLQSLDDNIPEARKTLSAFKDVLICRYKMYRSNDGSIKNKIKAVRILIDMIDKAYEVYDEDILNDQFDDMNESIKAFAKNDSIDARNIIEDYLDDLEDVINSYWPSIIKQEAKTLIETITQRSPENNTSCDNELFSIGSKLLREPIVLDFSKNLIV